MCCFIAQLHRTGVTGIGHGTGSNPVEALIFSSFFSIAQVGKFTAMIILHAIYQTREAVFDRDIQTPRRELKIRRAAEYF